MWVPKALNKFVLRLRPVDRTTTFTGSILERPVVYIIYIERNIKRPVAYIGSNINPPLLHWDPPTLHGSHPGN